MALPEDPTERLQAMLAQLAAAGAQARQAGDAAAARTLEELRRRIDVVVQQVRAQLADREQRAQGPDHDEAAAEASRVAIEADVKQKLETIFRELGIPSPT